MPGDRNGHEPDYVAACAQGLGLSASVHTDLEDGLSRLAQEKSDHALICGSLYLAGDVLSKNGEHIL